MQGTAGARRAAVDVRRYRRGGTDQQRGGACRTAWGVVAEDQWRHGQSGGQPVRGADPDGGGNLPAARQEGVGLPQRLRRVLETQANAAILGALSPLNPLSKSVPPPHGDDPGRRVALYPPR